MHIVVVDQIRLDNRKTIRLVKGDITERYVEVIINAANSYLKHGGGVAAAIVRKGGDVIQQEINKIGFIPVGSAVITSAGRLPCKAVIHAVGPRMGEGDEDAKLKKTIKSTLKLAAEKGFTSISMPAISSGIFGFPKERCANILVNESIDFFLNSKNTINIIEFCIIDNEMLDCFKIEFDNLKDKNKLITNT